MANILIAGATGLIGSHLVQQLAPDRVDEVLLLVRRPIAPLHAHHHQWVSDFMPLALPPVSDNADAVICALGTTIKQAGSREAFAEVDFGRVLDLARAAKQAGYRRFVVVSSLGADADAGNFYLATKGRMEAALVALQFDSLTIVQPSLLLGKRSTFRLGERIAQVLFSGLSFVFIGPLRTYRPVHAEDVASVLIRVALDGQLGCRRIPSKQLIAAVS
ncbi:NAD(P)H-binding protein [Reinekea forsetii]|uniref:Nucleoside-diphosphate-sugar epimerase n=1 Tax=Reinekea forsetii TaxID=1336806 RepID=A0A2K8KK27_9GAMM|nr:NAD(P)H-binding protein [Reinekea forsetii]ATX75363.1 nucleoside-diphosphate-sugar epimerase [Reinekea forsetii]